jgi:competence protein ComGB
MRSLYRTWRRDSQGAFLYKLGLLLSKGYTLKEGIELLKSQLGKKEEGLLDESLLLLSAGGTLSEIFKKLRFPQNVVDSLIISSTSGNLQQSLMENGNYMKKKAEWKDRLNKTLRYPLFLLFLTFWMSFIFYQFLYPQFSLLFSSIKIEPPLITQLMLDFLSRLPLIGLSFLILLLFVLLFTLALKRKAKPSTQIKLIMAFPLMNKVIQLMITYFFSLNFGALQKSGLSVSDALYVMTQNMSWGFYKEESMRLEQGLLDGKALPDLLKEKKYYTKELSHIVEFGQAHGDVGSDLIHYGDWLFIELEEHINKLIMRLQPLLFSIIGCLVLFLFMSLLLPMFKIMEAL